MMRLPDPALYDVTPGPIASDTLSKVEQRVVLLACKDADGGDRGLARFGLAGLERFLRALTGIEGVTQLADARLETLRRFVCLVRHGDPRHGSLEEELITLGFAPEAVRSAASAAMR